MRCHMFAVLAVAGMVMQASQDTGQPAQANASPKFDLMLTTSVTSIASHTNCHVAAQVML